MYILFDFPLSVDEDVIKVYYHENVKLFYQDLIDIALKCGLYIGQFKRHNLVLKMAIAGLEDRFLFISFSNPYLIVDIGQIKLGETSSPTSLI